MIRKNIKNKALFGEKNFNWRGGEVSRLESLVDAVFAIAVTLLIVSRDVPTTFTEFTNVMWNFVGFAVTFTFLFAIWYSHYMFHRRYGLEDGYTIILNSILIFVILFYIYPLKFLATVLIGGILHHGFGVTADLGFYGFIDMRTLILVYSTGAFLIWIIMTLLYKHAYGNRENLELNRKELDKTKEEIQSFFIMSLFSVASIFLAYFDFGAVAGWIYCFIGPVIFLSFWIPEKMGLNK